MGDFELLMKPSLRVFIASSSEGLEVANVIRDLLGRNRNLEPAIWNKGTFELSRTYIESLEKELNRADFAVLALTRDDITTSRKKKSMTPRDNVLFELGLFMGGLGRERCYLVHDMESGLKLPSDLMGVEPAAYRKRRSEDLSQSLETACRLITRRINKLGVRPKLDANAKLEREKVRRFCSRIAGTWWERIVTKSDVAISFFQIAPDPTISTVRMSGDTFDAEGGLVARWRSAAAEIRPSEKAILYSWQGWHPISSPGEPYAGFGTFEFEGTTSTLSRGMGRFADIHVARVENTTWKSVELRRLTTKRDIQTMTRGGDRAKKALIERTLSKW